MRALLLALVPSLAFAVPPSLVDTDLQLLPAPIHVERSPVQHLRWGGGEFVQVQQSWAGLPIEGARLTLSYDPALRLTSVFGPTELGFPPDRAPDVAVEAAVALALEEAADRGAGALWSPRVEPALLRVGSVVHRTWAVDVSVAQPVGAWRVHVDAHDGRVLAVKPTLWTARADVYPTNPGASELTEVELTLDGDELRNDYASVSSCTDFDDQTWRCNAKEVLAIPDAEGDFFFDPGFTSSDDPFAEVQMFFHLDKVARWFEDEFGFRTDYGLGGNAIEGIVNFNLANAFFGDADGDGLPEVAFGQGNGVDFAYDGDVVYHEFGHAVFGSVVDAGDGRYDEFGRLTAPGGLNEGSADLFALAITGDPELGEYAGGGILGSGAIRHLEEDRHCPTDIYGESHRDGELWAALGWNLIDDEAIGPQVAAHAVFGALNRWDDEVTFGAAGEALLESIDDLLATDFINESQHAALLGHIEDSGFDDCGRVIRLDEGQEPLQVLRGRRGGDGTDRFFPNANQYSLDAPEGAVSLELAVRELNASSADAGYRILARRGAPIVLEMVEFETPNGTRERPEPQEWDFEVDGFTDGPVLLLDESSDPALLPGATYYFAVTGIVAEGADSNFAFGEIGLTGEVAIIPVEEAPGDEEGTGCQGCSASVGGGAWGLLMGLPWVVRRRRVGGTQVPR